MNDGSAEITTDQVEHLYGCLAFDFGTPECRVYTSPFGKGDIEADYSPVLLDKGFGIVTFYKPITLATAIHEFVHHIDEVRRPGRAWRHDLVFHRLCFEVRDHIRETYGTDVLNINGYTHTAAYGQALNEWFTRRTAA